MKHFLITALLLLSSGPAFSVPFERTAFVINEISMDLTAIDLREQRIKSYIPLVFPGWQIVVSEERGLIIVSELETGGLMLFDAETERYLEHVELPVAPEHMQLSPDGTMLALVDNPNNAVAIVPLDGSYEPVVNGSFDSPHNVVFSADSATLFVANKEADAVSMLEIASGNIYADIWLDKDGPFGGVTDISLIDGGRKLLAVSANEHQVATVDLANRTVIERVSLDSTPYHGFPTADGQRGLVTDFDGGVSLLDFDGGLEPLYRGDDLPVSVHPMLFDSLAVVVAAGHPGLGLIDLDNRQNLPPLDLPAAPERGVVSSDGSTLFLPMPDADAIAVFSAIERRIVAIIDDVGDYPWQITMAGAVNYCY